MGGIRKLFISNKGFDNFAESIYNTTKENKEQAFPDIIACRDYIMSQFKLASKLSKVASISLTDNGELRIRTNDLFISDSSTGKLRKFFVGKWKVTTTVDGAYYFSSANKKELGFNSDIWGEGTVHPHISGRSNYGCLGNAEAPLQLYLKTGSIKTLVIYILGYLESVNIQDSAGVSLGYCHEVALDDNGNVLHDENGNYKFISNEFDRERNHKVTTAISPNVDTIHHEYITCNGYVCDKCRKGFNKTYIRRDTNGNYYCKECIKDMKTCSLCGQVAVTHIHDNVNDLDYCENCANTLFNKCTFCKEYMFPKINKDDLENEIIRIRHIANLKNNFIIARKDNFMRLATCCDSCKSLIMGDKLNSIKPIKFNRLQVANTLVDMPEEIPLNKYRRRCSGCTAAVPVENSVTYSITGSDTGCSTCATPSDNNAKASSISYRLNNKYLKDNFVKVIARIEEDSVAVHTVAQKNRQGVWLPRAVFKDQSVWKTIKEDETIKYKIEGRE